MSRLSLPALLLASSIVTPSSAAVIAQHQFSCLSREVVVEDTKYRLFDCLAHEDSQDRNNIVDHVIIEKLERKDHEPPTRIYYNPLDGANMQTATMFEKPEKEAQALTSKQLQIFQNMFDVLISLEEEELGMWLF